MKKICLLLSLMLLPLVGSAQSVEIDGIYYNLNSENKTAEVTSKTPQYTGDIVIPEEVIYNNGKYSVTSIGNNAFTYCSGLTSVNIGNSVTSIGVSAFYYCDNLTSVTIGNCVTSIENYAFSHCYGLTSIIIPNSVTIIRKDAFSSCSRFRFRSCSRFSFGFGSCFRFRGCPGFRFRFRFLLCQHRCVCFRLSLFLRCQILIALRLFRQSHARRSHCDRCYHGKDSCLFLHCSHLLLQAAQGGCPSSLSTGGASPSVSFACRRQHLPNLKSLPSRHYDTFFRLHHWLHIKFFLICTYGYPLHHVTVSGKRTYVHFSTIILPQITCIYQVFL